jgi:hypothetical protein
MSKTATITQEIEQRDDGTRIIRVRCAVEISTLIRIAKPATQTAVVLAENGKEIEARLYGRWVTVPLVRASKWNEDDALTLVSDFCKKIHDDPSKPLTFIIVECVVGGELRYALVARPWPPIEQKDWGGIPPKERLALSELEERYTEPWLTTVAVQLTHEEKVTDAPIS